MDLNNSLLTPPGLRLCYWHPQYEPLFLCQSSKQSEAEKHLELEQMEQAIFANPEKYRLEASEANGRSVDESEEADEFIFDRENQKRINHAHNFVCVFQAFDVMLQENNKEKNRFGLYNIQTIAGVQAVTKSTAPEIRAKFLRR